VALCLSDCMCCYCFFFFFFSSRRRHTRFSRDWSSDVCSSDLRLHEGAATPWPRYGRAALRSWVQRVIDAFGEDVPVFVYFNNDQEGAAPVDAAAFADLCSDVLAPMPWRRPSSS